MQQNLLLSVMGGLLITYLVIGYFVARSLRSSLDYLFAGKTLGIPAITATLLAAQVGGGMFLGTAENPFHGLLYIFGIVLGLLILGLGLAQRLRALEVESIGAIFEKKYGSRVLKNVCDLLSVTAFLGILIAQIVAAKSLLLTFAGIENNFPFILFWLGVTLYTMIGGFHTIIITDFFRIVFITVIFSGICIYNLITTSTPFFTLQTGKNIYDLFKLSDITYVSAVRIMLVPALFCLIEQDLAQKFFAARTQFIAGISALYASFLLLIFSFIPFYFGIQSKLLNLFTPINTSPLLPFLQGTTNTFFFTIALCALLSAITSTTDSLLCAISSILTKEVATFCKTKPTIFISRSIILVTGITTLIASFFVSEGIISILIESYEIAICGLLIPFIASLFLKNVSKKAAWVSVVIGLVSFIFFKLPAILPTSYTFCNPIISTSIFYNPYAIFISLALSTISYLLCAFIQIKYNRSRTI